MAVTGATSTRTEVRRELPRVELKPVETRPAVALVAAPSGVAGRSPTADSRAAGRLRMQNDPLALQLAQRAEAQLPAAGAGAKLPTTVKDAEPLWLAQNAGTLDKPSAGVNLNCGPTSLAMSLRATGQMPPGLSDAEQIQYCRALMTGAPSQLSYIPGTNIPTTSFKGGVKYKSVDVNGDGKPEQIPLLDNPQVALSNSTLENVTKFLAGPGGGGQLQKGWDALDAALKAGKPVVADGRLSSAWASSFDPPGRAPQVNSGAHFISILGKNGDNYIVADPMSGGPVEMSRDELKVFFQKYGGEPSFAAVN